MKVLFHTLIILSLLLISCGEDTKNEFKEKCTPACETYETCSEETLCVLLENRCKADIDCTNNYICNLDNNTCEENKVICNEDKTTSDIKTTADSCGELTKCNDSSDCADNQRCENLYNNVNEYTNPCCVEGPRGCKEVGETCENEFDCNSGLCIDKNDGTKFCSKVCDPNNNTCPTKVSECKDLYVMFACVEPAAK